jgi:SEC-C motif-containing protein
MAAMARRTPRRSAPPIGLDDAEACPCGLGLPYGECCGPAHRGRPPAAAEALMRSRYAAFVLADVAYVLGSWHPSTRPADFVPDPGMRWTGLDVLESTGGGLFDAEGVVEFRAHYRDGGRPGEMRERSRFVRQDGQWVYWGPILTDGSLANI